MDLGYLSEIIACPECRSALSEKKGVFQCRKCRSIFKSKEGIPLLAPKSVGNEVKKSVEAAYEEFDEEPMDAYYKSPLAGYFSRLRVKKLLKEAGDVSGKKVLDIGCEAGYVSSKFQHKGAKVSGFDVCFPALVKFRKRTGITPVLAYSQKMPFKDNSFQLAICTEVIEHMPDLDKCISEMHRVLQSGGMLLLTFPNEGLRKRFYPLIKLFSGINTDVEEHVTLFEYDREQIYKKFSTYFRIRKKYMIHPLLPVTNFAVMQKE